MDAIKRGLRFLAKRPTVGFVGVFAYVIGVLSVLPFGVTISAEVATVIAAITGSLAAVFGGLWVAERTANAEEQRLSSYVATCIMGVATRLLLLEGAYTGFGARQYVGAEKWVEIEKAAHRVLDELENARLKLATLSPAFYRLRVVKIFACDAARMQFAISEEMARHLLMLCQQEPTRFFGEAFDSKLAERIIRPRFALERVIYTLDTGSPLDEEVSDGECR
ncbi:MAG: hypothetical protein ACYC0F_09275 [Rhodanobacter sp.]